MKVPIGLAANGYRLRTAQWQVAQFHDRFGQTIGTEPGFRDEKLRHRLVKEEYLEFCDALPDHDNVMHAGDFVEAVDGVIDSIYVLLGTLVAWGVDGEPLFRMVHEANMTKVGDKDDGGKIQKGPGWVAPDIRGELIRQGWKP